MATRNLTKQFIDARNAAKANRSLQSQGRANSGDEDDHGLLKAGGANTNWKSVRDTLPPAWVDTVDQIDEDVKKIQDKIKELGNLHKKRLMVDFQSDEAKQERDIDIKTQEITQVFRHSEALLKTLTPGKDANESEIRIRENMKKSTAKKLQELSSSFRATQKDYMARIKAQKSGSMSSEYAFMEAGGTGGAGGGGGGGGFEDNGFTQSQLSILEDTTAMVEERDQEIMRIAKSIEELAQIFRELAVLVIDQGTILDRIDYNMEQAVERVEEGVKQLTQAEEHQKNSMPFKCIIVLVLLIIIMLGILIWKHSPQKNNNN